MSAAVKKMKGFFSIFSTEFSFGSQGPLSEPVDIDQAGINQMEKEVLKMQVDLMKTQVNLGRTNISTTIKE